MSKPHDESLGPTQPDPGARPLEPTPPDPGVTAELLLAVHQAAIRGSGMVITEFERGASQTSSAWGYWAMALAARLAADPRAHEPPLPPGVSAEEAERIRGEVRRALARRAGK